MELEDVASLSSQYKFLDENVKALFAKAGFLRGGGSVVTFYIMYQRS